jgi:capsular polysaccharide biosynthesis protein/Tfp pilus assembly protein PilF
MSDLSSILQPAPLIAQIEANPEILSNYWQLGLAWLLQGEEAEAQAAWFSAAIAIDPDTIEAGLPDLLHLLRQEAARQSANRQFQTAERIYQHLWELEPIAADALAMGSVVSQQGRYEEAIAHWQNAIDLEPDDQLASIAYAKQAEVWQKLGQLEDAIAAYRQAIELHEKGQTLYQLGLCLAAQGDWQAAIAIYRQAIQHASRREIQGDLGWALLQSGELEAAIAQFQQANLRDVQLDLKVLWDGHLARPSLGRQDAHPTRDQDFRKRVEHRVNFECYEVQAVSLADTAYTPLDADDFVPLQPPKTLDAEVHFSFRFGEAIALPGSFVVTFPNGRFWLSADQTSSALFTADDRLIGDLSPQFPLLSPGHPDQQSSQRFSAPIAEPVRSIEGTVVLLAGLTNDLYFHWLLDILPRWNLVQRSGVEWSQIDWVVVSDRLPFQRETLDQIGIPISKRLAIEQGRHLQADRLIVPSYPGVPAWMPRWAGDWLQQTFLSDRATSENPTTRLYISRSQTTSRRIRNEAAVLELLQPYGFQCVCLESLSVQAQAKLLASAEIVVGAHGGGLTNLVFCQPGTKVIELFSPRYVYPCYWWLSNLMQLQYAYLLGKLPIGLYLDRLQSPDDRLADIWIDLAELRSVLEWLI